MDDSNQDILQTCPSYVDDCIDNFNGLFAVAIVAFLAIAFSFLGMLAEIGMDFFRAKAQFLFFYAGRGIYLALVGTMCLGIAGAFGLSMGIISILVGALELLYGVVVNRSVIA